jgi:N-acetylneuraminate synthase
LCTPYGITSAKVLRDLGCERLKIASPELNHLELLSEVSEYGLPIYLSTGVSRLSDIETALEALVSNEVTVLHCVTAYPAPPSEYNLRVLASLAAVFGVKVGVSDHSLDPRLVSTLAVSQGARAVEKHITLSRSDPGLDDPIAQDEDGFQSCVDSIRQAETETPEDTLARVADEFGEDLVQEVLGDGVKRVAPAEAQNYGRTNRSLHVVRDIPAGHVLCRADFQAFRTEKKLRPGLPPEYAQKIVGCRTTVAIPAGEGLRFEDLVNRPATDYSLGVST